MNKLTKGTIAAGAAVLLLLGTGGTLAYWNATAPLGGVNSITAGTLSVVQSTTPAPSWQIKHNGGTAAAVDINTVQIVPGDQLIYTGTYTITGRGQNLAYTVGLSPASIAAVTPATPASTALVQRLVAGATFSVDGSTPATQAGTTYTVAKPSPTNNGIVSKTVVITATITWDGKFGDATSTGPDNSAKTGAISLADFALTINQIAAS